MTSNKFYFAQIIFEFFSLNNKILSEDFIQHLLEFLPEDFLENCTELCILESQTFLSAESEIKRKYYLTELRNTYDEFAIHLQKNHCYLSFPQWRFLIGIFCAQVEWAEEVGFEKLSDVIKENIFSESPLASLPIFLNS